MQQAQDKATGRRWRDAANDPQNGDPYAGIALGYGDDKGAASSSGDDAGVDVTGAGRYEGQSTPFHLDLCELLAVSSCSACQDDGTKLRMLPF